MNAKVLSTLFFFIIILISSCSGLKDIENYKGDNISISVGDTSSVRMIADTKNGYDWVVTANSDPTVAKFTVKENLPVENNNDNTTQVIKFKGLKKGKTIITLNYVKKGDMLVKQTRTLNILVY